MENVTESHVEVRTSPTAGNGLFATKDIGAGELILMIKRPLVGVLDIPRLEDTCSNCFMWSVGSVEGGLALDKPTVNACTGCKKVKYCSKKCQSQAWKREHKQSCKFLKALPPLPHAIRAARELSLLMAGGSLSGDTKESVNRMEKHSINTTAGGAVSQGIDNLVDRAMDQKFGISMQATREILLRQNPDFVEQQGVNGDYVGMIWRNSFTLVTPTYDPLGLVFDPLICTANHSCDPNSVVVMDGPLVSIRSLTPIPKGSEIFISYVDNTNPFALRQAELRARYCFTCACSKCAKGTKAREDDWLRPADQLPKKYDLLGGKPYASTDFAKDAAFYIGETADERRLAGLQGMLFTETNKARESKDAFAAVANLQGILGTCHNTKLCPITRQPYAAARNELFASMLATGQAGIAMMQMVKIYFSIDPILYPQDFHPVRVVHAWALVKVLMWLYEQQDDPVTVSLHGQGFDFVVIIYKLLKQLRGLVGKSHGFSRFQMLVEGTAAQVAKEVGANNIELLERDPDDQWEVFRAWKDVMEH